MIDQNLASLEDDLNGLYPHTIKAVSVFELRPDFHDYTEDEDLVLLGRKERFILLTRDVKSINKTNYPPCKHGGIIKLPGMPSKEEVLRRVRLLIHSGPRYLKEIRGHFTHLNTDGATIYKENDQTVEVRF
ncbi:MAG: hypothetical protein LC795_21725 [Acidobacteria bacterium]|nr:hypothetical protein [Acidobacteriota bacterium]